MRNFISKKTAKGHFQVAPSVYELFMKNHIFIAHFGTKILKNMENKCISTPPPPIHKLPTFFFSFEVLSLSLSFKSSQSKKPRQEAQKLPNLPSLHISTHSQTQNCVLGHIGSMLNVKIDIAFPFQLYQTDKCTKPAESDIYCYAIF